MNWEIIMWSCVTVIVMLGLFGIILSVISARNMKKNRAAMQELQNKIQIGQECCSAAAFTERS